MIESVCIDQEGSLEDHKDYSILISID